MHISKNKGKSDGFTLIELLVVIAIISLLVSILLPSLKTARELASNVYCRNNLRTIGIGFGMYIGDFNGHLPAGYDGTRPPKWWPFYIADSGSLPNPYGYRGSGDTGEACIWNCHVAEKEAKSIGAENVSWTYVRVRNRAWWSSYGMGGWININECVNPSEQLFVIDSLLTRDDIIREPSAAKAGALNGAMVCYDLVKGQISTGGTGGVGFIHPAERANALHADWHVEGYDIDQITENMCEEPNR